MWARARSATGSRWLGFAGAVAMAAGGWTAGTLPARDPWGLWTPHGTGAETAGALLAYAGLTLLLAAWWAYGRSGATVRHTLATLGCWAAPLALTPPLYSADVYSYIAQGAMVLEGHDVYQAGPSVLDPAGPGGDAAASVGGNWRDTPAPYGPFFLLLARAVAGATGGTLVPAVLALRLLALAALLLIVWAVRRLATSGTGAPGGERREAEGREAGALWLGVLNPLLLMHVVGGIHNDGLMIALMLTGVVLARRGRWVLGSAAVGLAMMVKSPAALALLFIGVLVGRAATGRPAAARVAKGLLAPGLVAAAVVAGASLAAGTGFGWLRTQSVAGSIHTALSVTSDLGLALGEGLRLLAGLGPGAAGSVKSVVQTAGLLAALVLVALLALRSARGRLDPVYSLGLALTALVVLSPMVQPWYLLWGLGAVAAAGWDGRAGRALAVLTAALTYETHPSGATPWYGFVLAALAALAGWWLLRAEAGRAGGLRALPEQRRKAEDASI
ncbi:polyprenol phosphomannose-dependent alpha 1,6 mannosyltransferase MptB [Streptomyces lichenis]|uniref:Polyprenol phosphomannose-dependent alpha 1,6 mannosyltransferase MptB n=1 Tax=Streptomyces lichenis TaxID=2306967 RepID=A0ABT0IF24_9ACTN|nr:polyprenol phosphomannose-dependent alpha 1,6 mannosyltransferase MptB [Streptomyces lichenis]MCK8679933.1 polyprenol phosphomannose-dependent alpha 1,6 mannosyltransferase MptB [Streptomyces lichenis]